MKTPIFLLISILALSLAGCNEPEQRIARSVGATSEILVVTQSEKQWEGEPGEAIRTYFGQDQYGLPQPEPLFKLAIIQVDKLSDMFKKHRNLLVVEINQKLSKAEVETRSDLWSKPQRVIKITAPDYASWVKAFEENKEGFKILFERSERERLINIYRPTAKIDVMDPVQKAFQFKMLIPEGFYIAKQSADFMWLRKETNDFGQGIILYQRNYRDTLDFSLSRLIKVRDSLVMKHIPGPTEGSFMSTDKEFVPPVQFNTDHFVTDFGVEVRGMWNVTGDFMAGPFVSYSFVHPTTNKLVTAEGYVYAPNKDKRDHLRQLEALLYSISF